LSKTESRFPTKGTCLAIYSRCVNAETEIGQVLGASFPWCSGWVTELKELFGAYVEAKQKQNVLDYDDLLLYSAQTMSDPALADDIGGHFEHVLSTNIRTLTGCSPRRRVVRRRRAWVAGCRHSG
jgi:DNA helicase II / ATP-dependent DNA helicase PcrA